ncbi:MAG: hypothetical protein KIC46_08340, partial [Clostridiales bacterium]|nr:hypothetical protein [Clostridiales bacterium]
RQFVRPFFHRAKRDEKIPSRATQSDSAGAALASRQRPAAHNDAGYESDQKPCFFVHFFLLLDVIDKLRRRAYVCTAASSFSASCVLQKYFHFLLTNPIPCGMIPSYS